MMNILIVDDKHDSRYLLEKYLQGNDYQTYGAANGRQALYILETTPIDLIVSDILMPEMDGYMLCKQVKADPRWANIPLIFFTATFTSRQDEIFAVKLGATRFIRKPAEPEFLIKSIKDVLESQAKGYLEPAKYKFKDEKEVYKVYNERLIKKLEKKVIELEECRKAHNLSQGRLSKAAKIAKLGYWEYLVKEDIFIFDDYFYAIFHTTAEEVGGYQMKPQQYAERFLHPDDRNLVQIEMQKAMEATDPDFSQQLEHRILYADGGIGYISVNYFIEKDQQGRTIRTYGVNQDITMRKQAEIAFNQSEEKYRILFENAMEAILVAQDGFLTFVNRQAEKMIGYSREELTARQFTDFIHPDDRAMVVERHTRRSKGEEIEPTYSFRIINSSGEIIIVEVNVVLINWNGQPATLNFLSNITERRKAELNLKESEERYRAVVENSQNGIIIVDSNYRFIYVNDALCNLLGCKGNDIIGHDFREFLDEESKTLVADHYIRRQKSEAVPSRYEFNVVRKNGEKRRVEISSTVVKDAHERILTIAQLSDITERKQFESALKISEEKFRDLFEYIHNGVVIYEAVDEAADFIIRDFNKASENIEKVKRDKVIGKRVTECFPGVKDFGLFEVLQRVWRTGKPESYPVTFYTDDRITGWRENYVFRLPTGEVVAVYEDLTQQKRAEEEKQKSEQFFRLTWENSIDGMRLTDENGTMLMVNEAFCKIVEMPEEALIGQPFDIIYAENDQPEALAKYKQRFEDQSIQTHFEKDAVLKSGKKVSFSVSDSFLEIAPDKRILLTVVRDITEQKSRQIEQEQLRSQLLQSQKMEAIGNLAGGVAHDFNNLLTVIQGHAQLLMLEKDEKDPDYHELKQIINASSKAANLTRQLLLFSRKQVMEFKPVNLNETITNLLKMIKRLIGENIEIETLLEETLWNTEADEGNLEQVIVNLVVNARDAMPTGGKLKIETSNINLNAGDCQSVKNSRPGKFVCLSITDSGQGIQAEILDKIFDPFFTTKEPGKGTGLGLSVVYGIVKKHNGWINVYSEVGHGTVMKIYLPVTEKTTMEKASQSDNPLNYIGKGEKILIVEDNVEVRKFTEAVLHQNGYLPIVAATASQAIELFQKENGEIDLIVSDVILPDKNGVLLVEDILKNSAGIPIILCSGYAEETLIRSIKMNRKFHFLQKPYQIPDLLKLIHEVLSKK